MSQFLMSYPPKNNKIYGCFFMVLILMHSGSVSFKACAVGIIQYYLELYKIRVTTARLD